MMEEIRLYDINSIEFNDLIDTARVELKRNNSEYKELQNKVNKIMESYPNLQLLFEDDRVMSLNKEECKMLQKLASLHLQMSEYEERTKEYYKEIDKFNKLADEMSLICTYNLNSKEDTQNLRMKHIEEVTPLKAEREKLRHLYKKATNEADKTIIQAKIDILTEDINKINSKIQTCKRIIAKLVVLSNL